MSCAIAPNSGDVVSDKQYGNNVDVVGSGAARVCETRTTPSPTTRGKLMESWSIPIAANARTAGTWPTAHSLSLIPAMVQQARRRRPDGD
jgi:hypothetical protein